MEKKTDRWLTPAEVASEYPVTRSALSQLRYLGHHDGVKGPRYSRPTPRKILYRAADVEEWLRANLAVGVTR